MTVEREPADDFRSDPLHNRLVARLREMIVSGELAQGEPISEKALCARFGVSRTPLREALKVLGSEGLVDLPPRRGAVVSTVRESDVVERFAVLRLVESHAVEWICDHGDAAMVADLRRQHDRLLEAQRVDSAIDYFDDNERFHRALVEATGNRTLIEIHAALVAHLRRARFQGMHSPRQSSEFVDDHGRILAALVARDAATARREIEHHQRHVETDTLAMIRSQAAATP